MICLGSEKAGVCVLHLFFADLGWGGDMGFLLRSGTECFLSKGFCLARLYHVFGQEEQSFLGTLKTTSSSIGLFRLSGEVFDVLCQGSRRHQRDSE